MSLVRLVAKWEMQPHLTVSECTHVKAWMYRSEDILKELVLSFHHVIPGGNQFRSLDLALSRFICWVVSLVRFCLLSPAESAELVRERKVGAAETDCAGEQSCKVTDWEQLKTASLQAVITQEEAAKNSKCQEWKLWPWPLKTQHSIVQAAFGASQYLRPIQDLYHTQQQSRITTAAMYWAHR